MPRSLPLAALALAIALLLSLALALVARQEGGALRAAAGPRLTTARAEAASADGRCRATVLYPRIDGLADARVQSLLNRYVETLFRGGGDRELRRAVAPCDTTYLASIGFTSTLHPSGLLSVKRTRAVVRGSGFPSSIDASCHVLDLRRGRRVEVAQALGAQRLARIEELADKALEERFRVHDLRRAGFLDERLTLARGDFSFCFDATRLLLQIGPSHAARGERGAVEVALPLASVGIASVAELR